MSPADWALAITLIALVIYLRPSHAKGDAMDNTAQAQELYEAYRRQAAAEGRTPPLTMHWAELPIEDRHFWKGVVDRLKHAEVPHA